MFNDVHPENHGYTVLNLLEIRRPWKDEQLRTTITVGNEAFDY